MMKTLIATTGLALALTFSPMTVSAQQADAEPSIVVSAKYKKDWNRGSELEAKGLRDMEEAKRDLVEYSADVVNAQDKQTSSQSRAANARQTFENLTARPQFTDADEAAKWAKQVDRAASDWAKYDDRGDDGRDALSKASKRQAQAQEKVDKAQARIDKGRTMMADAERSSMAGGR